ncbi:GNAT family N-acetyltransferase [Actinoalloteichus fjordicus]|uniref:Acetyltransferase (GNAT) family protein n=1 Tax=Actinoalloteichus fjordicus TaxID=1612552 RepID=A0AAC9LBN4_9PSEU|nr:GNAT family N-acetyltransferase [Actinoalloteichus fjordicus]APU14973.1 acetyltransferase (GNAT) family protein [Actinoalloteichus fjordicus]
MPQPVIRPYRPADRDAVYDVCRRTVFPRADAAEVHPDLMADIFAGPYLHLQPELAFVLDDGERAVGYVIGAADTVSFAAEFAEVWLPMVADRHPPPGDLPHTPDEEMRTLLHAPGRMVHPVLADHPAHLHIDLLPQVQRSGYGRALMWTLLAALNARGVPRVHLGMVPENVAARAFYDRLGFEEITVPGAARGTYLGRSTEVPAGQAERR